MASKFGAKKNRNAVLKQLMIVVKDDSMIVAKTFKRDQNHIVLIDANFIFYKNC